MGKNLNTKQSGKASQPSQASGSKSKTKQISKTAEAKTKTKTKTKTKNKQTEISHKQVNHNLNPKQTHKNDNRFNKAAYDPKFMRPKKELTKVKIDSRFSQMLTDPKFQNLSKVDKYGRKIQHANNGSQQNEELKQFYIFDANKDTEEHKKVKKHKNEKVKSNGSIAMQKEKEEDQILENSNEIDQEEDEVDFQQFQGDIEDEGFGEDQSNHQEQFQEEEQQQNSVPEGIRQWMQNYDQESSSLEDMPIDQMVAQQNQGPQVWSDDDENMVKNAQVKATKRLALCNYDWMNINSKDLMILFSSFKPAEGIIKSIKVYMSNLGKQKLQQEETFGPQGIWKDEQVEGEFAEDEENDEKNKKRKSWKQLLKRDQSSAMDSRRLRAYEKQRLKYYYAVIECNNKKTADQIYRQCDGNQFQHSNLQFDLRFIPDEVSFEVNMLKQQCNEMPLKGQVKTFITKAMGHSKVDLTWEDPELSLPANLKKKNWNLMTQEEFDKVDWGTYLDQGADVDEEDNRKGLQDLQHEEQNEYPEEDEEQVKDNRSGKQKSSSIIDDKSLPDWKRQCNKKLKNKGQSEELVISFDSGFTKKDTSVKREENLPSLKKQKKSKKQLRARAEIERQRKREELALLNDQNPKQTNFEVNLKDKRFQAVFNNPQFSLDPSNPKFDHRRSGNVFKQVVQRNKIKHLS